jgi:predicted 3-demethylubiquinone-9 3-methyltransferase (glyoxalase superfamily)
MASKQQGASSSKIVPHLWYADKAVEAANFYCSVFPDSAVKDVSALPADSPSGPAGSVDVVEFSVWGQPFTAFNAGPLFQFNPSISFIVNFDPLFFGAKAEQEARRKIDEAWEKLSAGGKALIPIDKYPFSERYGWIQDKYGLTWQLMLTDPTGEQRPPIVPSLMFTEQNAGKAEEAVTFYLSVFRNSRAGAFHRYPARQAPDKEGTIMFADFMLENQWFGAMDSAKQHGFGFNEAVSLMVKCDDQREIDHYWGKLSAAPKAEQCGWLKDRYGVSWQIAPRVLGEMMKDADKGRARRVAEAMLQMKKLDIPGLERAYAEPELAAHKR